MNMPVLPPQRSTEAECRKIYEILSRAGERWTILVINQLSERPYRFNELKRSIGQISQQMLARTLRALEADRMISRKVYPTVPPNVEYTLTELEIRCQARSCN